MQITQFLYEHPVFTYEDFKKWKQQQGKVKDAFLHTMLHYHVKNGKLLPLRRGMYAVVPPNSMPETLHVDSYLIAAKAAEDSVLSHHTALELHGFGYTSFEQFTFFTRYKVKPFMLAKQWYRPVLPPTTSSKTQKNSFGIESINRQGLDIKITNVPRTFVDVVDRIDLAGGIEEVYRCLKQIAVLDIDLVIKYCLMLHNSRLAAKVGFFLEQRHGVFAPTSVQLKKLMAVKPQVSQYLTKNLQKNCRLVKKWNLFLPEQLLNQTWEEPHAGL